MLVINPDNSVVADGQPTGLRIAYRKEGSVVFTIKPNGTGYREFLTFHGCCLKNRTGEPMRIFREHELAIRRLLNVITPRTGEQACITITSK